MKKRSHKNTTRLIVPERVVKLCDELFGAARGPIWQMGARLITHEMQAAVKEALARDDRRDK
jgi:hypothetical protein